MSNVEAIEQQIEKLSPAELTAFPSWYAAFDAEAWDRQFEAEVQAGKLDALAVHEALIHHPSHPPNYPGAPRRAVFPGPAFGPATLPSLL